MSPAFYKGKLHHLIQIATAQVEKTMKHFDLLCVNGNVKINMISEISNLMVRLLLSCVIGEDLSDTKVDYWINGQLTSQDLSFALRNCFS